MLTTAQTRMWALLWNPLAVRRWGHRKCGRCGLTGPREWSLPRSFFTQNEIKKGGEKKKSGLGSHGWGETSSLSSIGGDWLSHGVKRSHKVDAVWLAFSFPKEMRGDWPAAAWATEVCWGKASVLSLFSASTGNDELKKREEISQYLERGEVQCRSKRLIAFCLLGMGRDDWDERDPCSNS